VVIVTSVRGRLDGGLSGPLAVILAAAVLAIVAVVVTASPGGLVRSDVALAFGAFIALGELARITLPGGRDAAPIATAGAWAYALLNMFEQKPMTHSALQVVAVVAVAMIVGVTPHVVAGRAPSADTMARRLLAVGFAVAVFRATGLDDVVRDSRGFIEATIMVAIVAATLAVDAGIAAAVRAAQDQAPFLAVLRNEGRAQVGIGSAIGATGALIALAASIMGIWALPVFVIPLLLTQFSFRRYAAIRASSLQTIRALSRVTELGGYTEAGHSRRVSELAVAVGRELGMSDADLLDLEYAALMHDIGQLSLQEPIPGGATVVAAPAEQRRIAGLGADVIRETRVMDRVADIVERQAEPYRRAHHGDDLDVPLASRIIKAVNAYDDLVGDLATTDRQLEAVERLRLGMAYEYDPRVVDSMAKAIERSSRLGG
jgi:HD domain-containing protein